MNKCNDMFRIGIIILLSLLTFKEFYGYKRMLLKTRKLENSIVLLRQQINTKSNSYNGVSMREEHTESGNKKEDVTKHELLTTAQKWTSEKDTVDLYPAEYIRYNWTLLLAVNNGFYDFFLNWYAYYEKLDLALPIQIYAEDDQVYTKLKSACEYCTVINSHLNLPNAYNFKEPSYNKLVSTRPHHILDILKTGRNVLYVDVDTVWLQNPLPFINTSADITAQRDGESYCTGLLAIRANENSIAFVQQWHKILSKKAAVDQFVFNQMMRKNNGNVTTVLLNPLQFPDGRRYFKLYNNTERAQAVIVHNNVIVGHDMKVKRFKDFNLWKI